MTTTNKFPPQYPAAAIKPDPDYPDFHSGGADRPEDRTSSGLLLYPADRPMVDSMMYTHDSLSRLSSSQGWKFMSFSHCQELYQQANWRLICY